MYLYWVAKGADACMIHGNSHSTQELPTQGFLPVEVNEDTHFTLTCSGEGRDDQERRILVSVAEGGENEGKESLLRETFDLGHLLNHLVYDGFVQPIVWRVAAWAAPAVLVAYYQHLVGRRAHQH
ncbi:MAG: hypothetical protein HYW48_08735 [Deltaproteobacteria bacterium]|nr:hypothetical protein [Deltaproteobacteria bacterium]